MEYKLFWGGKNYAGRRFDSDQVFVFLKSSFDLLFIDLSDLKPGNNINKNYIEMGHIVADVFEPLYKFLRENNYFISVDLGGYTVDSHRSADACLCFGASVGVAGGFKAINQKVKVAAIIGDAPFLHSGKNVLPELILRDIAIDVFIMDNNGSQGTGGQVIPGDISKIVGIENIEYYKVNLKALSSLYSVMGINSPNTRVFHIYY